MSLFVAHWLGRWCASLATQVQFLACLGLSQLLQGRVQRFCVLNAYKCFISTDEFIAGWEITDIFILASKRSTKFEFLK